MTSNPRMPKTSWTKHQRDAIDHHTGRMMVLAGAGSGKTAVLAQRCAALVAHSDPPCSVEELLVVTFTIEAAGEMRRRITIALRNAAQQADVPDEHKRWLAQQAALAQQARVSTVHAFCSWVLRTWFNLCGVDPAFSVLDDVSARLLWAESFRDSVRRRLQRDGDAAKFKEFFDHYADGDIPKLQQLIEPIVNLLATLPEPDGWMNCVRAGGDALDKLGKLVQGNLVELGVLLDKLRGDAKFAADPKHIMATNLEYLGSKVAAASAALQQKGFPAWDEARDILILKDPRKEIKSAILKEDARDHAQAIYFRDGSYKAAIKRHKDLYEESVLAMAAADVRHTEKLSQALIPTLLDFVAGITGDYRDLKRRRNQLDFSDLERLTVNALENPDGQLADRLRRRFRHILFDEYQDINPLQQQLIKLLSRVENPVADLPAGSIFCVGDVFQSIYGFRGSRPQLLQEQVDQIKTTGRGDVVSMMENFRTLPPLIDAFNLIFPHVFADSENPEEPLLRHGRAKSPENISNVLTGAPLELHVICKSDADGANQNTDNETSNESDQDSGAGVSDAPDIDDPIADLEKAEREALLVARMIREMRGSGRKIMEKNADAPPRPIEFDDIAILMRTKQIQATQFVRILGEHGIPAYAEMTTGFFAAQEILEVLDLLHVLDNPAQDIPLASVLLGPLGNFSHAQLVRIRTKFPDRRKIAFHGAVPLFALEKHSAPQDQDLAERLGAFLNQLNQWRQMVNTLGVGEGLNHIYQTSGLLSSTAALPGGEQKLANLHLLRQKALEYSAASHEGLSGFAAFVRDLEQVDLGAAPIPAPGAVKVMSIHAAKGLEFPVVFLIGLGKKFNMRDLNGYLIVDDSGLGLQVFHQINGGMVRTASPEYQIVKQAKKLRLAEEEARLLYVAMTRARDRLVLVGHAPGTQNKAGENWSRLAPGKDVDRMLDWLGPIFTNIPPSEQNQLLQLVWHDSSSIAPQPVASSAKVGKSSGRPAADPNWTAMRAGQTLPEPPPQNPGLQTVIRRITTPYPYQKFTELAAVTTVSKLKTAAEDFDEFPSPSFDPPEEFSLQIQPASTGIQRGTATHTILQQLDLRADLSLDGIRVQIEKLISSGQIPPDVAATVDAAGIAWFFTTTPGQQMQEIAMKKARGDNSAEILREQVFLWRNSDATNSDRFDDVLVRGAIDVLLIDGKNVQIIDYKTDAPTMIESRLPAYRKQVQYYARAAGDILKTPITTATLVFLSAHRCEIVDL